MRGIKLDEILPPCPKCLEKYVVACEVHIIHNYRVIRSHRRGHFKCQVCLATFSKKESDKFIKAMVIDD